jgi:hypothetical protein
VTERVTARGLRGDWLNGWLAAVGVTVLVPEARLAWSADAVATAEFKVAPSAESSASLAAQVGEAIPGLEDLDELAIAACRMRRSVSLETYSACATVVRGNSRKSDFTLGASVTDLTEIKPGKELMHSRFDPPAPRGETLWMRVRRCRVALGESEELIARVAATLEGRGVREAMNGLGFDARRLSAAAYGRDEKFVDPVIELLAFFGLALLPVRGHGDSRAAGRGWRWDPEVRASRFVWPVWSEPLDRWGIDALLGLVFAGPLGIRTSPNLGLIGGYEAVAYRTSESDPTRGFSSKRSW